MIAKLVCYFKGHKRGKPAADVPCVEGRKVYRCPRCTVTWTRWTHKAKAA